MTSNYLSTPTGNELPFSSRMTSTTVNLLTAGNNGARVTLVRIAEVNAVSSTTMRLEVLDSAGSTAVQMRGEKALAVHEVYQDYDVRLQKGETLRVVSNVSGGAHVTGLYVDFSRGPGG